ncbi:MAG: imidazole glycerol phosphate synthase subunit HisH [Ruminococcus sp.]|nr:imidazole glycerol phosphate synthase subunit HisH [Ruminococcus sp.]
MIAVIDYGAGNLFSVANALDYLDLPYRITDKTEEIRSAEGIILPGVGAFAPAMELLRERGFDTLLREEAKRKPLLGICLGMQMLFEKSYEFGEHEGLGLLRGEVVPFPETVSIVPHMGWNKLEKKNDCPLMAGLSADTYVYFVHSYKANGAAEDLAAVCDYEGVEVPALVYDGGFVYGAQFHPEKSGDAGLQMLRNFGGLLK